MITSLSREITNENLYVKLHCREKTRRLKLLGGKLYYREKTRRLLDVQLHYRVKARASIGGQFQCPGKIWRFLCVRLHCREKTWTRSGVKRHYTGTARDITSLSSEKVKTFAWKPSSLSENTNKYGCKISQSRGKTKMYRYVTSECNSSLFATICLYNDNIFTFV